MALASSAGWGQGQSLKVFPLWLGPVWQLFVSDIAESADAQGLLAGKGQRCTSLAQALI